MKKTLLTPLLLLTLSTANAGFLVEPWLGYNMATSGKGATEVGYNLEFEHSSPSIGAKIAYTRFNFEFGADLAHQSFSLETDNETEGVTVKDDFKRTDIYLYAGLKLPVLMKGWFKYLVSSSFKGGEGGGPSGWPENTEFSKPSGFAIGIGYSAFPMVNLNAEFKKLSWGEYNAYGRTETFREDMSLSEILFSVSLPLSF